MRSKRLITGILALLAHGQLAASEPPLDEATQLPTDQAVREQWQQRLDELKKNPESYRRAVYEGELRATLCKACHGEDGNSVRDGSPSLAGQDPVYIIDQFDRYADGRRRDPWMSSLSSGFSDEDKLNMAVYYAEQPVRPAGGGDPSLIEHGRKLYETHCVECHGANGRDSKGYARLAGQRPEYTIKMLREFRTPEGKRFSPAMYSRVYMLKSEQDLVAVATYLAHLD